MSFTLESLNLDLGSTPIENIFINDFMPMADGTCVKVYLLGYKHALENTPSNYDNLTLAKNLNLPLTDVLRAWDFWEEKGIVKKHYRDLDPNAYDIEFINLKSMYVNHLLKPQKKIQSGFEEKQNLSYDQVVKLSNHSDVNDMFNVIRKQLNRYITPDEQKNILDMMYTYNMTTEMVGKAFEVAAEKKKGIRFVESILKNWHDSGITNMESYMAYYEERSERFKLYTLILKRLGISGLASSAQKDYMDRWLDEYGFYLDIILKACDISTVNTGSVSFAYIDKILLSWKEKDFSTLDDIEKEKQDFEQNRKEQAEKTGGRKTTASPKLKTKLHNFNQWTDELSNEELNNLFRDNK